MEYIKVSNKEGTTIINDSFKNLALKEVVRTPIQGAFGYKIYSYNEPHFIINKKEDDLVFVAPNGKGSFNKGFILKNTKGETELLTPSYQEGIFNGYGAFSDINGVLNPVTMCGVRHSPSAPHSFKCYVYSDEYKTGKQGLEVFNKEQKLIFSSENKYLKIKKYIYEPDVVKKYVTYTRWGVATAEGADYYPQPFDGEDSYGWEINYTGVIGNHVEIARYTFDKPIAICPISIPSCQVGARNGSIFFYFAFIDEKTFAIYAEINVAHSKYNPNTISPEEYSFDDVLFIPVGNNRMLGVLVTEIE